MVCCVPKVQLSGTALKITLCRLQHDIIKTHREKKTTWQVSPPNLQISVSPGVIRHRRDPHSGGRAQSIRCVRPPGSPRDVVFSDWTEIKRESKCPENAAKCLRDEKNCFLYLHIKNVTFVIREGGKKNNLLLNSVNSAEENIYSLIINLIALSL